MKAVKIYEKGGLEQLVVDEVAKPEVRAGEVLVRVNVAAMNRRDVFVRKGQYPGVKFPAIPGADGAGEVVEVGEGVSNVEVGHEVVINPALNWGDNPRVFGPDFSILGVPVDGTHAEYVRVPAENVTSKPAYLEWDEAAALPLGGTTAYRALFTRGELQAGETVVIPGIGGGVATFLLQMATAAGANVYVTSSDDAKIEKAKQLGAVDGVNYRTEEDWRKQLKKMTGGADLIVDTIGGDVFNELVNLANSGSRIVTFGATAGPVNNLMMPLVFLKQLDIKGTSMGTPEEFAAMLSFYEKHEIHPVIDTSFSLDQIREAHEYMEKGQQFGKITLKC
ncbi:zinc-binding dehydrogenase [Texcoconibacillus texcoconensis]|uniref:NADPH:quinone reductase-like Zn-dependent oxidoreductase n=1 Tax=Texcoconibacillus texcoconensis TaxID=1095777 RepID=A0A840QLW3_9BACI|nr:zinc-binding dehydrogenase [Texcoconibacillus texcoconensis]MBB5172358.1 NADPH:quinone reductase-like Zn-dependent oxidoreductase [Texcoconibacillus texcoconensis]